MYKQYFINIMWEQEIILLENKPGSPMGSVSD